MSSVHTAPARFIRNR